MAPSGLIEEVRALTPLIRQHRAWSEEHVRIAPEVHEALGELGVFRISAPREYGGLESDMPTELAVYEELAFADPSVAWVAMNSSAGGAIGARMKPEAAERLFEDPQAIYGFGLAPSGKAVNRRGGFDVSGRWPVVSGCDAASWFLMASKVYDGRKMRRNGKVPVIRFAAISASDAQPLDSWSDVVAVRGSGSHAVEVAGSFVRRDMMSGFDDRPRIKRPYFKSGFNGLNSLGIAAVSIGIARYALESAVAQGTSRRSVVSGMQWREWPAVQNSVASADAAVYSARAGISELTQEIWTHVSEGKLPPKAVRARMHALADHSMRVGRQTVSDLFTVGSVDAIHEGHGLERALRDVHGFGVQWERYRNKQFQAGAAMLGAEIEDPTF